MLKRMSLRYLYPGGCHCQNISLRLDSDKTPAELPLRTDTCSFCNKHHAIYTSDPEGELHLVVRDINVVKRYRFGTETADFLICKSCGVFVAAYMPDSSLAVINVNVLEARAVFLQNELHIVDLDAESRAQRLTRRRRGWTPVPSFVTTAASST
jgi:hypothetical protein